MSEKYPGFFTAIFGGRKAKEPELKPEKKTSNIDLKLEKERKFVRPKKKNVIEKEDSGQSNTEDE